MIVLPRHHHDLDPLNRLRRSRPKRITGRHVDMGSPQFLTRYRQDAAAISGPDTAAAGIVYRYADVQRSVVVIHEIVHQTQVHLVAYPYFLVGYADFDMRRIVYGVFVVKGIVDRLIGFHTTA